MMMYDVTNIARLINENLSKGSPVVLASIVMLSGSSPRHNGAKMLIASNGKSYGTIGGSLLEATTIKESWAAIAHGKSKILNFNLNGKDASAMGMICGGKTSVLIDYVAATPANQHFFEKWQNALQSGQDYYFVTHTAGADQSLEVEGHSFWESGGAVTFSCSGLEKDAELLKVQLPHINTTSILEKENRRIIVDPIRRVKTAYLFGAGHVAVPTAYLAAMVGFRVVVIDDREEFANNDRFPTASSVRVIEDFKTALADLEIDKDSFLIIVTRGHQYDREVLAQALQTRAGYIGMISSRRKRDTIYAALREAGVSQNELDKVHSPIGIPIGGETPEEIAVSIVAELINVRTKQS
jgi:xanthine dehydrogenase accessory factor